MTQSLSELCTDKYTPLKVYFDQLVPSDLFGVFEDEFVASVESKHRLLARVFYRKVLKDKIPTSADPFCEREPKMVRRSQLTLKDLLQPLGPDSN